ATIGTARCPRSACGSAVASAWYDPYKRSSAAPHRPSSGAGMTPRDSRSHFNSEISKKMTTVAADTKALDRPPILVDFALQGGGSHGAFTWGVLDRLLEEPWLGSDGISGTSAGGRNCRRPG